MKIVIEESHDGEEDQIIIKCREMTEELIHLLAMIKSHDTLIAYDGNNIHRIQPKEIYYIEVVDNKTFLYCKNKVLESKQKLYELDNFLSKSDFLRVSKSVLLNLSKIKTLSPALSGRFEATLSNNEKIIISRQYVSDLKKILGI
ncbi:LytTR family DNA-binding domain-containing protein [Lacrimispora amygdalina]|uniref:LytTR family DNA-binding domain-containing protein n=1 Tax=Lacrimispora amygdalina TaxID=253257 RepID=UPI000BE3B776|nr:LytTR family DNA-binding domain-containing protein [Lacrimispora amygdalina]